MQEFLASLFYLPNPRNQPFVFLNFPSKPLENAKNENAWFDAKKSQSEQKTLNIEFKIALHKILRKPHTLCGILKSRDSRKKRKIYECLCRDKRPEERCRSKDQSTQKDEGIWQGDDRPWHYLRDHQYFFTT